MKTLIISLLLMSSFANHSMNTFADPLEEPIEMATYPGGTVALIDYLNEELIYPMEAIENAIEGKVLVSFIIAADGTVGQVEIIKGLGNGCDKAAKKVVASMPKWKPAKKAGQSIPMKLSIPIEFSLTVN